jgi:hypothetical protein
MEIKIIPLKNLRYLYMGDMMNLTHTDGEGVATKLPSLVLGDDMTADHAAIFQFSEEEMAKFGFKSGYGTIIGKKL